MELTDEDKKLSDYIMNIESMMYCMQCLQWRDIDNDFQLVVNKIGIRKKEFNGNCQVSLIKVATILENV